MVSATRAAASVISAVFHSPADKSRWRVSERDIRITDARALADATHIHARECVPLAWAFPLEGRREEAGRFWAFFPTHTPTYVPGILNAPWKVNSDRNAIIGCREGGARARSPRAAFRLRRE
jgi:hypothetical protein